MKTLIVIALITLTGLTAPAQAETTIGRWCDRMVPSLPKYNHTMAIIVLDNGDITVRRKFKGGTVSDDKLREKADGTYASIKSTSGDKYRINTATGDVDILDNDGYIRSATRLENTRQPKECI